VSTINASLYNGSFPALFEQTAQCGGTINVWTPKGNAVILSEEEYRGLMETLYIFSLPGMKEKILDGINTPIEECFEESLVDW